MKRFRSLISFSLIACSLFDQMGISLPVSLKHVASKSLFDQFFHEITEISFKYLDQGMVD